MAENPPVACTIVSYNYLGFADTVCRSYLRQHPDHSFVVLIVDEPDATGIGADCLFETVYVRELPLTDFVGVTFRFDVLELNTNVKPTFLKYLFQNKHTDIVIYLDPDIYVYQPFDAVLTSLETNSIVLTPHCLQPVQDAFKPSEQDFLRTGIFNLGFIGLRRSEETDRMLDWWETRCLTLGFHEIASGLFVDQKWMNLAPCFFSAVHILKNPGCNMAYWNLHERVLSRDEQGNWLVNGGYPLIFFHFSGIDLDAEQAISKYQNRYSLVQRDDLQGIFSHYRDSLRIASIQYQRSTWRYSFGYFSNGKPISLLARRLFDTYRNLHGNTDPFDAAGPYYAWADRQGLVGGKENPPRYTALTYNKHDWRLRLIHRALGWTLRVVGIARYTLLMKYLSFITVLGNQAEVFAMEERADKKQSEIGGGTH